MIRITGQDTAPSTSLNVGHWIYQVHVQRYSILLTKDQVFYLKNKIYHNKPLGYKSFSPKILYILYDEVCLN